jgi:general secretion pathway protein A
MYLTFYGLKEKPFSTTPDPKYLYHTSGHREALAQLVYGVQEGKGFIVLTGEVGTGKTTLLHALLQQLNGTTEVAFISFPLLSFDGILAYALEEFRIAATADSQVQRLLALNTFLVERWRAGQKVLLIIDEAQNLDPPTLEQIRLLSNFEMPTEKLLQILLVGQPELQAKLELPQLHQLKQRIALQCNLPRLTTEQTRDYIRHRLYIAGVPDLGLFTDRATGRIARYTRGIPRLVNIICDHCLLFGYANQRRQIDRDIVEQAGAYLREASRPRYSSGVSSRARAFVSRSWVLAAIPVAILGWVGIQALRTQDHANLFSILSGYLRHFTDFAHDLLSRLL